MNNLKWPVVLTAFPEAVEMDPHAKTEDQLQGNYLVCLGGDVYQLSDEEFSKFLVYKKMSSGHPQVNLRDVLYMSLKGEQGVVGLT